MRLPLIQKWRLNLQCEPEFIKANCICSALCAKFRKRLLYFSRGGRGNGGNYKFQEHAHHPNSNHTHAPTSMMSRGMCTHEGSACALLKLIIPFVSSSSMQKIWQSLSEFSDSALHMQFALINSGSHWRFSLHFWIRGNFIYLKWLLKTNTLLIGVKNSEICSKK